MDMGAEQGQNRMKLVRCAVFFYIYMNKCWGDGSVDET